MNIALVAHDTKKVLIENFCIAYRNILIKHTLYATGTTGRLVEESSNLPVHKFQPGRMGGYQQLAALIEQNEIDLVIFLRDPNASRSSSPKIMNILHLCDNYNIPLATNLATAELVVKALERGDLEWREIYH